MAQRAVRAKQVRGLALANETVSASARPKPARLDDGGRRLAVESARVMADDNCEDVLVLDLRGVSPICDYFVIGTGTSDRQMRATADDVQAAAKDLGEKPYGVGGYEEGTWIVVDYVDVVIHLFDAEKRAYYDLESLWGDRPRVEWDAGR